MSTIAYRIGWDRAKLKLSKVSAEYDPNFNPQVYAHENLRSYFNESEMLECVQGMNDFLLYNRKEVQRLQQEEKRREELLDQIDIAKGKKTQGNFLFYVALALENMSNHSHTDQGNETNYNYTNNEHYHEHFHDHQ